MEQTILTFIKELGGGLSATIIVIQFAVIYFLAKALDQAHTRNVETLEKLGKEQRELQALSNQAIHAGALSANVNSELLRQIVNRLNQGGN